MWHSSRPPGASPQAQDEAEELIPDPRGMLTPSEVVERRLAVLVNGHGQAISHMVVTRRSTRDRGPGEER
jgi:hypothetical protein